MSIRFACVVTILAYSLATATASAQPPAAEKPADEAKAAASTSGPALGAAAGEKPAADKPTEEKKTDEKKPDDKPAAPEVSPEMKAFDELKKQWADIREELFRLQIEFKDAKPDDRQAITEKFAKLHADGEQLQGKLLKAAEAVLAADPKNGAVGDFLAAFAAGLYSADRYDEALPLAEALIKAEYPNKRIYNLAGKAAFNLCEFDKAEKYLKAAQAASAVDLKGERDLKYIPAYKKIWDKEQELRAAEVKADDLPRVALKTTEGEIVLELFENEAPQTVGNFINLVEKGFYDGLAFHRVIGEFMAQGGDPKGDGTGGPGYEIFCECYKPEKRNHFRGTLSMAHAGKNTGGSQFFITFLPTPQLDGTVIEPVNTGASHTVFGRVISGFDVLPKLNRREPPAGFHSKSQDPPLPPDRILEAKVLRKRGHEYVPTKVGEPAAEEKKPEDKKPEEGAKPEEKKPEGEKKPEDKKPEDNKPDEKKPEDKKPEEKK